MRALEKYLDRKGLTLNADRERKKQEEEMVVKGQRDRGGKGDDLPGIHVQKEWETGGAGGGESKEGDEYNEACLRDMAEEIWRGMEKGDQYV